ncbi:unnamed protein product [Malus baccata var. baccata]
MGLGFNGLKARGEKKGKAGWPWFAEREGWSCYSSGHLKTRASSSDLGTNMKNKERERGFYLPKTITRSEVTGKSLQSPRVRQKTGVITHNDSEAKPTYENERFETYPNLKRKESSSELCSVPTISQGRGPWACYEPLLKVIGS